MKFTRGTFLKGSSVSAGWQWLHNLCPLKLVAGKLESTTAELGEMVPTTCWIGKQDCGQRSAS
jgi:hypothetical protein